MYFHGVVLNYSKEIIFASLVVNGGVNLWTNFGQTFRSMKDVYGGSDTASTSTVFVICWSPYIVFDLLQVYGHVPRTQTNIAVASFIQSLAPLNSAANPVIYCLFSTSIGRTLRQVQAPTLHFDLVLNNNCCRWRWESFFLLSPSKQKINLCNWPQASVKENICRYCSIIPVTFPTTWLTFTDSVSSTIQLLHHMDDIQ